MRWIRASALAALTLNFASLAPSQVADPTAKASLSAEDHKTIDTFLRATREYLNIQRDAPSQAKLKPTTDVAEIEKRRDSLQQTIVAARPNARQGDLFTPPVADLFRRLLAQTLNGPHGSEVRRSLRAGEPVAAVEAPLIAVNKDYPNQHGQPLQSAPATLLQNLPVLPKGLEYRMVGGTLVLRDTEASLVVDYVPNDVK